MRTFGHIFKREFSAYFISPVAYVVMAVFMILSSMMFYTNVDWYYRASFAMFQSPGYFQNLNLIEDLLRPLFGNLAVIMLFIIPVLTMRSFSEEKRQRTFELLLSYPVRDTEIVLGKYFAALAFLGVLAVFTLFFPGYLYWVSEPETGPIISSYLGFFLLGAAFIAIGLFASSTTENQIIAALFGFGLNLLFWIIGWVGSAGDGTLSTVLQYLSIIEHFDPLSKGILNSQDIIYYLSIIVFFIFLTTRVLQSKRWRG